LLSSGPLSLCSSSSIVVTGFGACRTFTVNLAHWTHGSVLPQPRHNTEWRPPLHPSKLVCGSGGELHGRPSEPTCNGGREARDRLSEPVRWWQRSTLLDIQASTLAAEECVVDPLS
jgi:hypothetical protein